MQDLRWVDREAYPFKPHYFEIENGRMHYLDEGQGEPVLLVHGTPAWSFLYRDMIKVLSARYRCIAPDHLGFGLSDKPQQAAYRPADHARRLRALIEHLGLDRLSMVLHDFGGPIGLSYAIGQPHNIRALVLLNTWMWSLEGETVAEVASIGSRGPLGSMIFQYLNFELRVLFKMVWGNKAKLSPALHRQYLKPFPQPRDRQSLQTLARELRGSGEWYEELWQQRERIRNIPALLIWGLKDPIFKVRHLKCWQTLFSSAQTVTYPEAGHFVQEEEHSTIGQLAGQFLDRQRIEGRSQ